MKNFVLIFIVILIQNNLSAQEYYHKFYNYHEVSPHAPWNFLVEDDNLIIKVGMFLCDVPGACTPLVKVKKSTGEQVDIEFMDISSFSSEDAVIRMEDQYYVLGQVPPFTNRPSIFILDEELNIKNRVEELHLAVDHFLFVDWGGMVERGGYIYALSNVRTNTDERYGLISKFDALTFQHQRNFFIGKSSAGDARAEDLQLDDVGNIYVFTEEDLDTNEDLEIRQIITKIDTNDVVSIVDSYASFRRLELNQFLVSNENQFVYSKDEFEYRHTRNWNDLLRGLNYEGDSLDAWLFEFPFEEPNADFSNLEVRKYDLYDIAAAQNGDILVCGSIEDTPDSPELGGPYTGDDWGPNLPIYRAGFISRISKYGELLWQRIFIFRNIKNPNLLDGGFEFSGDLLQVEEDANGDIYAVGRKTQRISEPGVAPMDSLWVLKTDKDGCLDAVDCNNEELVTSIFQVGTNDLFALTIQPNPVSDILYLKSPFNLESYRIYNSIGQLMQSGIIDGESIDVSQISKGIFFLTILTKDNKIRTEKIIKL